MIMNLLKAEYKKSFYEMKMYYPDQIVDVIIKYFIFFAFFIGFGKNNVDINDFYIGYLYWMIGSYIISEASISISFEKQVGTIEQIFIKPISILNILTVRTFVMFSISLLKFIVLFGVIMITMNISVTFTPQLLLIMAVSTIGFAGIGNALSGLTLLFAKTASFESIISYALLLISGSIISYEKMPEAVFQIIRWFPFVTEINVSQEVIKAGSLSFTDFGMVLFANLLMFLMGGIIFESLLKRVKKNGVMNKY